MLITILHTIGDMLNGHVGKLGAVLALVFVSLVCLATSPHVGITRTLKTVTWVILVCTGLVLVYVLATLCELESVIQVTYTQESEIAAHSVTSATYWKQRAEEDKGQETTNPHLLAARIIKGGLPITHNEVNTVLGSQGISVTQEELEELTTLPYKEYSLTSDQLKEVTAAHPRKAGPDGHN